MIESNQGLNKVEINDTLQVHHRAVLEQLQLLVSQVTVNLFKNGCLRLILTTLRYLNFQNAFALRQCLAECFLLVDEMEDVTWCHSLARSNVLSRLSWSDMSIDSCRRNARIRLVD